MFNKDANIPAYDYGNDQEGLGLERPYLGKSNALSDNLVNMDYNEGNTLNAVGTAEIRFLKDFTFRSVNSVYLDEYRGQFTTNPWFGLYKTDNGHIGVSHGRTWSYNLQQVLTWKHNFDLHEVDLMAGHEYYRNTGTSLSGNKSNIFSNNYPELSGAVVTKSTTSSSSLYNTCLLYTSPSPRD